MDKGTGRKSAKSSRKPAEKEVTPEKSSRVIRTTKQEQDSISIKLSMGPKRFSNSRNSNVSGSVTERGDSGDFGIQDDKRSPAEKLQSVEDSLSCETHDDSEKYNLLLQKKCLTALVFGEESKESYMAMINLGSFYNQQHRHESAMRILKQIPNCEIIPPDDRIRYSIEFAEAGLSFRSKNPVEQKKNNDIVLGSMQNVLTLDSQNKYLLYQRDVHYGRLLVGMKDYNQALTYFQKALEWLGVENTTDSLIESASVYQMIGDMYEKIEDKETAKVYYQKAYVIYQDNGLVDTASLLQPKIL